MSSETRSLVRGAVALGAAALLFLVLALWHPGRAAAATITVNNLNDSTVAGDGVSLREAVNAINGGSDVNGDVTANRTGAYGTNDTILFPTGFAGTITLTNGSLTLTVSMTIVGSGADRLTLDGGCTGCDAPTTPPTDGVTVLTVNNGVTAAISGLTVRHGSTQSDKTAGGVINHGTLTLTAMMVTANVASSGFHSAAGLYNDGALTVASSTLATNAMVFPGPESATGLLSNGGTVSLANVTIAGNTSSFAPFALSGIEITGGTATVTNSTITANSTQDAGAAGSGGGTLTLTNTIVVGNTSGLSCGDLRGAITSGGHNLIGDPTCGSGITNGVNNDIVNPTPHCVV